MDQKTPETAYNEHAITVEVESAPIDETRSPGWVAPEAAAKAAPCAHRVRSRDLKASRRLLFVVIARMLFTSELLTIAGLFLGGLALSAGLTESYQFATVTGLTLLVGSALRMVSDVVLWRTWRSLHRPSGLVLSLSGIGLALLTFSAVMVSLRTDVYWLFALLIPALLVEQALWYFRGVLYDRATCGTYPGFPPQIRAALKQDPGPLAVRVEADASGESRIDDCPHFVRFKDLRPRFQVQGIVNSVLWLVYLVGVVVMAVRLAAMADRFVERGFGSVLIGFAMIILLLPLQIGALKEMASRSKRYHRSSTALHVWSFVGFGLTALIAIYVVVLGVDLAWVIAALALYWAASSALAMKRLPPRSECRSLPDVIPIVQAMVKS